MDYFLIYVYFFIHWEGEILPLNKLSCHLSILFLPWPITYLVFNLWNPDRCFSLFKSPIFVYIFNFLHFNFFLLILVISVNISLKNVLIGTAPFLFLCPMDLAPFLFLCSMELGPIFVSMLWYMFTMCFPRLAYVVWGLFLAVLLFLFKKKKKNLICNCCATEMITYSAVCHINFKFW